MIKIRQDTYAIRCSKCNTVFGTLAHMNLYNKRICNACCETAEYDSNGLFIKCKCEVPKEKSDFDASKAVKSILKIAEEGFE